SLSEVPRERQTTSPPGWRDIVRRGGRRERRGRRGGDPGAVVRWGGTVGPVRAAGPPRDLAVEDRPGAPRGELRRARPEHVRRDGGAGHAVRRGGRDAVQRGARVR